MNHTTITGLEMPRHIRNHSAAKSNQHKMSHLAKRLRGETFGENNRLGVGTRQTHTRIMGKSGHGMKEEDTQKTGLAQSVL